MATELRGLTSLPLQCSPIPRPPFDSASFWQILPAHGDNQLLSLTVPAVGATSGTVATKFSFDAPAVTFNAPRNTPDTQAITIWSHNYMEP